MKKETKLNVAKTIFRLEATKGHLKWKVTELSISTRLSRQSIYSHFGASKEKILLEAIDVAAIEFYGLDREMSLIRSVLLTRTLYESCPEIISFCQKWRWKKSSFSLKIRNYEDLYLEKLKKNFPQANSIEIQSIYVVLHGLVTLASLKETNIPGVIETLLKPLVRAN